MRIWDKYVETCGLSADLIILQRTQFRRVCEEFRICRDNGETSIQLLYIRVGGLRTKMYDFSRAVSISQGHHNSCWNRTDRKYIECTKLFFARTDVLRQKGRNGMVNLLWLLENTFSWCISELDPLQIVVLDP